MIPFRTDQDTPELLLVFKGSEPHWSQTASPSGRSSYDLCGFVCKDLRIEGARKAIFSDLGFRQIQVCSGEQFQEPWLSILQAKLWR